MIRIITPVQIGTFGELKDHSVRISVYANELTDEEFLALRRMQQVEVGFMALQTEEVKADLTDLMDNLETDLYDEPKSPSQRLRNVLYRLHEATYEGEITDETFRNFYKQKYEALINHFKNLIP